MYLRELTSPAIREEMDPLMAKAALAVLQAIDTSSSQWRKTKKGSIQTQELKDVQTILNSLGYNVGKADGWFGRKTARGVMKFQKDNDLTVDGDPGKNTINKMIEVVGDIYFGTTPQDGTPDNPKEVNRLLLGQLKNYIFKFTPENYKELKDTHEVVYVRFRRETLYLAPIVPFPNNQTPPGNPDGPIVDGSGMPMPERPDTDDEIADIVGGALDNESLEESDRSVALDKKFDPFVAKAIDKSNGDKDNLVAEIRKLIQIDGFVEYWTNTDPYRGGYTETKFKALELLGLLDEDANLEEKQVWAKSGQKVVRKYRCTAGSRKGRVVKEPAQCFRAPDVKRRIQLKKTKARLGARMARKARRTKRVNPTSRRVAALNRMSK